MLAVPVFPAASRAVTVSTFDPDCRATPLAVQLVLPVAVPEPPRLFVQVTWVTPTLSDAIPCRVREELAVVYAGPDVGEVTAIVGFVVSAVVEHALWLPLASTALTDTKYSVPGARPASRKLTVSFDDGLAVADATEKNDDAGQGESEVP